MENIASGNFEEIIKNSNKYLTLGAISSIILTLDHIFSDLFIMSFVREIRKEYYKSLLLKDIEFYDNNKTSYLLDILTSDISKLKNSLLLGWIIAMFYVSFRLSSLLMILIPILYTLKRLTNKIRKSDYNKVHSFQSNSHNMVLESLNNIRIIKSFSTEKKELQRYEKRLDEMFNIEYNTLIKTQIMDNIGRGIFVLGLIFIFKLGYY